MFRTLLIKSTSFFLCNELKEGYLSGALGEYIIPQRLEKNVPIPILMFRIFICIFLSSAWFGLGVRQNFVVCFCLSLPIIYQTILMKSKVNE